MLWFNLFETLSTCTQLQGRSGKMQCTLMLFQPATWNHFSSLLSAMLVFPFPLSLRLIKRNNFLSPRSFTPWDIDESCNLQKNPFSKVPSTFLTRKEAWLGKKYFLLFGILITTKLYFYPIDGMNWNSLTIYCTLYKKSFPVFRKISLLLLHCIYRVSLGLLASLFYFPFLLS